MSDNSKKYFIYYEVYSRSVSKDFPSLEIQEKNILALADKEELNIVGIYKDSYTELCTPRREFQKMIRCIKKGQANGILLWSITGDHLKNESLLPLITSNHIVSIKSLIDDSSSSEVIHFS